MVVPYGDPSGRPGPQERVRRGRVRHGTCAQESLELGCDCLGLIRYFDAHLCDSRGEPLTIKNAICMHEEDYGILWKHSDRRPPDTPEVRRSRRLVVSFVSTVENYEYGFFWYLYQDGTIQFEVKLTGILLTRGLAASGRITAVRSGPSFTRRTTSISSACGSTSRSMARETRFTGWTLRPSRPAGQNPYGNAFRPVATRLRTARSPPQARSGNRPPAE